MRYLLEAMSGWKEETLRELTPEFDEKTKAKKIEVAKMWLKEPMKYETSSPVDALLVVTKPEQIKLSINKNDILFR